MRSSQKYRPKTTVLSDAGTDLAALATTAYYDKLADEDKALVDALCEQLDTALRAIKGKPTGIGATGLRELALALYIRAAYPGRSLDQCLLKATVG